GLFGKVWRVARETIRHQVDGGAVARNAGVQPEGLRQRETQGLAVGVCPAAGDIIRQLRGDGGGIERYLAVEHDLEHRAFERGLRVSRRVERDEKASKTAGRIDLYRVGESLRRHEHEQHQRAQEVD